MAPKTVVCCICGETVMKGSTYATGKIGPDGVPLRACKSHEGVAEAADKMKADANKKLKSESVKPTSHHREDRSWFNPEKLDHDRHVMDKCCWLCEQEGITRQESSFLMLALMKKAKDAGDNFNIMDPSWMNKYIRKEDRPTRVIDSIFFTEKNRPIFDKWSNRFPKFVQDLVRLGFLEGIKLCNECQARMQIWYEDPLADDPDAFIKMMTVGMLMNEDPEFQKVVRMKADSIPDPNQPIVEDSNN